MKTYLLIPHIKILDANALNGNLAVGFPAMTAWLGAVYALERKIREYMDIHLPQVAVSCIHASLQAKKGNYYWGLIQKRKPLRVKGNTVSNLSFIEEARIHLTVSLLMEVTGLALTKSEKNAFLTVLNRILPTIKIAGGDIFSFRTPTLYFKEAEEERSLLLKLMPGFIPIDRTDLLEQEEKKGNNALDALLNLISINVKRDKENNKEYTKKESGWLVPLSVGYRQLSSLGKVTHQRDYHYKHCFVEPLVTICEFKMSHRFKELQDIFWHYKYDDRNGIYLCTQ